MSYKFDVVLSFAGEQRAEVERVAACLKAAGLKVFYDTDEKADLWGRNLYDHLSDVYQNQAQYCILFASREYANKNWPSHERQSAQARALREKGNAYILPVRFDDTDVPGLPSTIAYLDFHREGPDGICKAFLQKIGSHQHSTSRDEAVFCESSPRALIQSDLLKTVAFPLVVEVSWKADSANLLLEPDDPTDSAFFDRLRHQPEHVIVAFSNHAAVGTVASVEHLVAGGRHRWTIEAQALESDFSSSMEIGTSTTTVDDFADIRARRILLNEHKPEPSEDINKVTREILIKGQGAVIEVNGSSFPALYNKCGDDPSRFVQIAWITAVMQLKLSNTVMSVDRLRLDLKHPVLAVSFRGTRARRYRNVDPRVIAIDGQIQLHN